MLSRASRLLVCATISAAAFGALAGCGDDDEDTSEETATTESVTTAPVEDEIQQAVTGAVSSCTDAAGEIEGEAAKNTAVTACEQVGTVLSQDVASLSASAREDTATALQELAEQCHTRATEFPAAQEQILAALRRALSRGLDAETCRADVAVPSHRID